METNEVSHIYINEICVTYLNLWSGMHAVCASILSAVWLYKLTRLWL